MKSFYGMRGTIRDYAWGHSRWIPEFMNIQRPSDRPAAELWMGAHPSAPSRIAVGDDEWENLDSWIRSRPNAALGEGTFREFGGLPFLFKLLAAKKPLSIQAHPGKSLAVEGFARENAAGIPRDAAHRNYKDDNHKPEIIMALSPFTAMIGFRPPREIHRALTLSLSSSASASASSPPGILESIFSPQVISALKHSDNRALESFLSRLTALRGDLLESLLDTVKLRLKRGGEGLEPLQREWTGRLLQQFPGDAGALAPLFLNILRIEPGEALYQPAGVLHAYLEGFGVELMANSDNVLRGGLTSKNIDVDELLNILEFRPFTPSVLRLDPPGPSRPGDPPRPPAFFQTPAREFALGITHGPALLSRGRGPFIVLTIEGDTELSDGTRTLALPRGSSAFVPFEAPDVHIRGRGRAAAAALGTSLR